MIIVDTSALVAFFRPVEPHHKAVSRLIDSNHDELVISPYVMAELDYLIATRVSAAAAVAVLRELASGAYTLAALDAVDVRACADVCARYADQNIGVTDASLVVLAHRYRTRSILTLDHRHFSVMRPVDGGRFKLLPS